jgi:MarR family transcriptional regulator, lower aerobic nicotinate degradation pathway regulator
VIDPSPRPPSLLAQPSYLASQVSKYGRRLLESALTEDDLALIDHGILTALNDFGACSQQLLADSLDFDKSVLVRRVDRLQRRGLVTRSQDPSDRRRNQVTLTRRGKALIDRLRPIAQRSQEGFLGALTAAERETLISLLSRVLAANDAARLNAERPRDGTRGLPDGLP